jgi:hypothetical protein
LSSVIVVANALRPDLGPRLRSAQAQVGRADQAASPMPGAVT